MIVAPEAAMRASNAVGAPVQDERPVERAPGGALRTRLAGGRWHFQHGPIDLVLQADGEAAVLDRAVDRAWMRFQEILPELVIELKPLRLPVQEAIGLRGPIARTMAMACWPHRAQFITPMAAVAGAVADDVLARLCAEPGIARAYVNNGGDIALHLSPGTSYRVGLYADLARMKWRELPAIDGDFEITWAMPTRGVATSGWRGRSFSLGIADSVTVLAGSAAEADAAATMVANSVDVDDPAILRQPASELKDDTDLGERLVTVNVGILSEQKVAAALDAGVARARELIGRRLIHAAVLCLQGATRIADEAG